MAIDDHDSWVPGNLTWDQLDFDSNCTAWGRWLGALIQPDPWDPKTTRGMSFDLAMLLFLDATPKGFFWNEHYKDLSTYYSDVSSWFAYNTLHTPIPNATNPEYYQFSERFNKTVLWGPKPKCEAEFCKAIGYTGSQDLCGIGVVISYYLEAILGTMFLVTFSIHQVSRHFNKHQYDALKPRAGKQQTIRGRVLDSFRGSLDMFLSGAMLIAVAMLGAALYSSITSVEERAGKNPDLPSGEAVYEMALSLMASNFSVFPVMLLYALVKHDGHRKWLHRLVLVLLWALSACVVFLAPRAEVDYAERKSGRANFDCDQRGSQYWRVVKATQFLVVGLPLLWLVVTVFLTTGFGIPGAAERAWVRGCRSGWRLTIAWINLVIMWGILAYFTHFRQNIIDAAGGLDKNDKWTFGQVLALATWVPVVAEMFYILAFGLEDSLSGHMPSDYHASHVAYPTQADPNMGVPLLHRDSTYDLKQASTHTSCASVATTPPATREQPSRPTAWHDPNYKPFQQSETRAQRPISWDPYYHTGW